MNRTISTFVRLLVGAAFLALAAGCTVGRLYVNREADMGFYSKVGVLTFANLTSDQNAAEKVTASFITELLMLDAVSVANAGDFNKAASETIKGDFANALEDLTSEQAFQLGQAAGVEGIFVGAVSQYGMVRSGQTEFPLVAVIVRFVDCQTGAVVWSYETSRKGGPKFPIFSFGETHTLGEMTTKVCREVAGAFGQIAR
ncbi:MAG TPA: hypothetical protein PLR32_04930 [candidate division Zixibacteria bacterium]|nr:hypothetical protein [candidate division Zixibacteria bacterium]MDD4916873.1 hypothetical protein [candidate division Zixibacteria bacterium]MDM7971461.1 hypothetical protein [candidate division Zixibacteria bacterium]HPI32638.1 hypothetical protein [candidate division Zixibacteria bacterium]HPM36420.1 hypothetical protein [candidate division Zixibacteria bacterium]